MAAPRDNRPSTDTKTDVEMVRDAAAEESAAQDVGSAATRLLDVLTERLGGRASVDVVFGDAVTREGVTVIPVARVAFGFGGGLGRGNSRTMSGDGGGGGGSVEARPAGFVELRDGRAVYHPIRDPWGDVVMPLAAVFLGTTAPLLARALLGRHGGRGRAGRRR